MTLILFFSKKKIFILFIAISFTFAALWRFKIISIFFFLIFLWPISKQNPSKTCFLIQFLFSCFILFFFYILHCFRSVPSFVQTMNVKLQQKQQQILCGCIVANQTHNNNKKTGPNFNHLFGWVSSNFYVLFLV